ncbi:MAG: hypothetical protein LBL78_02090 [Prevotellaceae bacterium]|jgi:hypothetical protein|nr:hypothetical protein [Prevotellaceae bacterium]
MKKYTLLYIVTSALALLTSCNNAELPGWGNVEFKLAANWKNYMLQLDLEEVVTGDLPLLERGLVIEYAQSYEGYVYNTSETLPIVGSDRSHTVVYDPKALSGTQYFVYAYAKTPLGLFRSEQLRGLTGPGETFAVTGMDYSLGDTPSKQWLNVTLKGRGFPTLPRQRQKVSIVLHPVGSDDYYYSSPSSSTNDEQHRLEYLCFGDFYPGTYEVFVSFDGTLYNVPGQVVLDGVKIVLHEPEHPRYGDEVTLHLEGFDPAKPVLLMNQYIYGEFNLFQEYEIVEVGTDMIRVRLYPRNFHMLSLYQEGSVLSLPYTIYFAPKPWAIETTTPVDNMYAPHNPCVLDGVIYLAADDGVAERTLYGFDTRAHRWTAYPFPKTSSEYFINIVPPTLVARGEHVYVSWEEYQGETNTTVGRYYRLHPSTAQWEALTAPARCYFSGSAAGTDGTLYYQDRDGTLTSYDTASDRWSAPGEKLPGVLLSADADYLYTYAYTGTTFRRQSLTTGAVETVVDLENHWSNTGNAYTLSNVSMFGSRIYFPFYGALFGIDVSEAVPTLRSFGENYYDSAVGDTQNYLVDGTLYLFSRERRTIYRYRE